MRQLYAYVAAESTLCIEKRMFSATTYCRTDQYCPSFYNQLMVTILAGNTDFWFVSKQNFIALGEIDPLNRRHSTDKRPDVVVQGMFLYFNSVLISHAALCFFSGMFGPVDNMEKSCLG